MADLVECTRCNKKFLDEEYDEHRCIPEIKKMKTIKYAHSFTYIDATGRNVISIRAMDGTDFEFIEVPENKSLTKIPYQPFSTTKENTTSDQQSRNFSRMD